MNEYNQYPPTQPPYPGGHEQSLSMPQYTAHQPSNPAPVTSQAPSSNPYQAAEPPPQTHAELPTSHHGQQESYGYPAQQQEPQRYEAPTPYQSQPTTAYGGHATQGQAYDAYQPAAVGNSNRPPRPDSNEALMNKQQPQQPARKISKKWQHRLYWIVPLGIFAIVAAVLFEHYKSDFERWVRPLTDWLRDREAWSWVIPVGILCILSFPPLFGHEIVQLIVGLTYPLGVALGIACAGSIVGEAACFIVFKLFFTKNVDRKIANKIKWAAVARVAQDAGFKGVLVIRYSIVPPHLANPLFACTGMSFFLYMITVILSLPKALVFVALGTPSSEHAKSAKYGKVVAIGIVVIITVLASFWIRKRMAIATKAILAERGLNPEMGEDGEYEMLGPQGGRVDTEYRGATANQNGNGTGSYATDGGRMV